MTARHERAQLVRLRRQQIASLALAVVSCCLPGLGLALDGGLRLAATATPDHWQGVDFDRADFDAIRRLVARQYIEPRIDLKRAWVAAANGALGRLDPSWELLPRAFVAAQRPGAPETGSPGKAVIPFRCGGRVVAGIVLQQLPSETRITMQDDRDSETAWRERAARKRRRQQELHKAWRQHGFGRRQFDCAMAAAKGRLAKSAGAPSRPRADVTRLWIEAANGLLRSLDPHSMVISRKAWDAATSRTQDASFEGIGAILTQHGGRILVENPMRGLPAWQAGLRAGDELVSVDEREVVGLQLDAVVQLIRGPRDTEVVLGIRREASSAPVKLRIRRARVAMPNVSGELLPSHPGMAHVRMSGFVQLSTVDLRATIRSLAKAAPRGKLSGLILDLRGNGGGLLDQGLEVADMFLTHGRIVGIRGRRGMLRAIDDEVHDARRQPGWDIDLPLVVLVDDSSASAAEIVAAALQDNGRALVVGTRTFGKGSVQRLVESASDYYVKLTMWRYQAPSGRSIQANGVTPDIVVGPNPAGPVPRGFREEDLDGHLAAPTLGKAPPLAPMVGALLECERRSGRSGQLLAKAKGGPIRPDYQLLRSADLGRCLARLQSGR